MAEEITMVMVAAAAAVDGAHGAVVAATTTENKSKKNFRIYFATLKNKFFLTTSSFENLASTNRTLTHTLCVIHYDSYCMKLLEEGVAVIIKSVKIF